MSIELEMAQIMWKLARKNNWGAKYDRLEHFKRFQNLDTAIKQFQKESWIMVYKKPNFTAVSLNTKFKKEIIEFIEKQMSYLKGAIK